MSTTDSPLSDEWRRPTPSGPSLRKDLWVALVLAAATAVSVSLTRTSGVFSDSPVWIVALWVALITLPLALRRRWPEVVALTASVVFAAGAMLEASDMLFSNICLYIALYSVGAWGRHRIAAKWVRVAIVAGMFIWLFAQLIVQANQLTMMPDLSRDGFFSPYAAFGVLQVLINLVYFGAAWYFGESAWISARNGAALKSSTAELVAERERTAAQAITLERVRIARELHDVVAHHVSVMGVQAGAARRILSSDPGQAADALTIIEQSARSAVDELHTMLGALRGDDAPGSEPTSQSSSTRGIAQLGELADESRTAGVPVRLSIVGDERAIPATIGLSIYRIAQEALTNTRKHGGPGVSTDLRLRYETDAVELEITDDGVGPRRQFAAALPGGASAETTGLGQRGMRERVAAVGGELHLGGRPRGGYLVRARFPLMKRENA
ncbi:sensor histidine kinase [Cryobacterium sp. N19]|uniref:sensor histidine kinase n=1 Tax=Cryobacterium sp. N19 TaxID=2048288 RepID=UPI000CE3331D|nr:sensor histidine kinase [Cryobacterium sp. N19]